MTPREALEITSRAEREIIASLPPNGPRSFFLYAGAGSGKTRALVEALRWLRKNGRERLWTESRKVAVMTFTNAATDEIKRRIDYDPFVHVSTIHAFAWDLIGGFDRDIRAWLTHHLEEQIERLMNEQAKGRAGSAAAVSRALSIQAKHERLKSISAISKFVYSPVGDNSGRDALGHAEVIGMCSEFLQTKPTLRRILVDRFPIVFVDESQDTNHALMDALLSVQSAHQTSFCLGLFGDVMQRIYSDGKVGLEDAIPNDWAKPAKLINYRCPSRILRLINQIRSKADNQLQVSPPDRDVGGIARIFIAGDRLDRPMCEDYVVKRMATITGVSSWGADSKRLILEHHMAATRLGFSGVFLPLYKVEQYRTALLEGSLPELRLLTSQVIPLLAAAKQGDRFRVAAIVRAHSPILQQGGSTGRSQQIERLSEAKSAIDSLCKCFADGADPPIGEVLEVIDTIGLFELPPILRAVIRGQRREIAASDGPPREDEEIGSWHAVFRIEFSQLEKYSNYVSGASQFGTHQGVKGLEFPHVMVIIDDSGARGFMFSYAKLFGLKDSGARRVPAQQAETSEDRTRRLLYVTCSRAMESLALVAYTTNPVELQQFLQSEGWFAKEEVEIIEAKQLT